MEQYKNVFIVGLLASRGNPIKALETSLRLSSLAGFPYGTLILYDNQDENFWKNINVPKMNFWKMPEELNVTQCHQYALKKLITTNATHILLLTDDLLPGLNWLRILVETSLTGVVLANTGTGDYLGFSAGLCEIQFLKDMYGDELWPTCYKHYYADAEIGFLARANNKHYYQPNSVLYHVDYELGFRAPPSGERLVGKLKDEELFNDRRAKYLINRNFS